MRCNGPRLTFESSALDQLRDRSICCDYTATERRCQDELYNFYHIVTIHAMLNLLIDAQILQRKECAGVVMRSE